MTDVILLAVTSDELEAAQAALEAVIVDGGPLRHHAPAESLERKLVAALERPTDPSVECLQAALDALHAAGLLTVAGGGVPADLAAGVLQLRAAVEFYSDPNQYERLGPGDEIPAGLWVGDARVLIDRGARARRTLRAKGTSHAV